MHITIPSTSSIQLDKGGRAKVVEIPEALYDVVAEDLQIASHLSVINEANFKKINGIYIRAQNKTDALTAAIYAYKKYVAQNNPNYASLLESGPATPSELDLILDGYDTVEEEFLSEEDELCSTWQDGAYKQLPIVNTHEFIGYYTGFQNPFTREHSYLQQQESTVPDDPYWSTLPTPLIIPMETMHLDNIAKILDEQDHFVILIEAENENTWQLNFVFGMEEEPKDDPIPDSLKGFLFETNIEYVVIPNAKMDYLTTLLQQFVTKEGYELAEDVNKEQIIQLLLDYRKTNFKSGADIKLLVQKAIRYTEGTCITDEAFRRFFLNQKVEENSHIVKASNAYKELQSLIGLHNVKSDLIRLVERMKFATRRQQAGLPNMDHHMAAVFLGAPGTCKTTVARIFGQLLVEAKVLSNPVFLEVSRKDLVGQYVGWTAPKVQELFDKAKGGTIFIDEAYSLNPQNHRDGFSDEALATIIQSMENNPNTLVIFAGYTEEMKLFIQHANPGLRSRLTNILQFDDYSANELLDIFYYQLKKGGYTVRQKAQVDACLQQFLMNMSAFPQEQLGNGRLMRKLVSTAVGFMAMRSPKNINLLTLADIEASCDELLKTERFLQQRHTTNIGFKAL